MLKLMFDKDDRHAAVERTRWTRVRNICWSCRNRNHIWTNSHSVFRHKQTTTNVNFVMFLIIYIDGWATKIPRWLIVYILRFDQGLKGYVVVVVYIGIVPSIRWHVPDREHCRICVVPHEHNSKFGFEWKARSVQQIKKGAATKYGTKEILKSAYAYPFVYTYTKHSICVLCWLWINWQKDFEGISTLFSVLQLKSTVLLCTHARALRIQIRWGS